MLADMPPRSPEKSRRYWLLPSSELWLEDGATWFRVVRSPETKVRRFELAPAPTLEGAKQVDPATLQPVAPAERKTRGSPWRSQAQR